MSATVPAEVTCPQCRERFRVTLYRTLWIEQPDKRDLIFSDKVNIVTCPSCHWAERLEFPLLATNAGRGIAVWYEPYRDDQIDRDLAQYDRLLGKNSFLARAPRIREWWRFKEAISELEQAAPLEVMPARATGQLRNTGDSLLRRLVRLFVS
jgi:hypothetical protein